MTNPNEPTLTCSEVVERLAAYIVDDLLERHPKSAWKHYIERALHSWRERRVQELEEALRQLCIVYEDGWESDDPEWDRDAAWKQADALLASSEWREQIRKGAKHE